MARATGARSERDAYRGQSAPPIPAPTWHRRLFIERVSDLRQLGAALSAARRIAIDAEFVQARVPRPDEPAQRLALLQFATDGSSTESYVVDALRLADLSPLQRALGDGAILKLFHGISADARMLASRGLEARHVLDLEAVSRSIFGQRESSLQTMLQRACGVRLDKSMQRADWSRRPLTPAMIAYAARDAEMTYALYGWLAAHYDWAVAVHEVATDEPPTVAAWLVPYIEGTRSHPIEVAVAAAGIAHNVSAQERDLRLALASTYRPSQRARLTRAISDLALVSMTVDLIPLLRTPTSEERAAAARALGRLHATAAADAIARLVEDPVAEVRQAAQVAVEQLQAGRGAPVPPRLHRESGAWTVGGDDVPEAQDWRATLRAHFTVAQDGGKPGAE